MKIEEKITPLHVIMLPLILYVIVALLGYWNGVH